MPNEETRATECDDDLAARSTLIESEVDVTPMVDVTFLLLIFFMVTASFTAQQAIAIPSPKVAGRGSDRDDDREAVIVKIDQYNTFLVQGTDEDVEALSVHELQVALRDAKQDGEEASITKLIVRASSEALHHRVVSALDAGQKARFQEIHLIALDDEAQ